MSQKCNYSNGCGNWAMVDSQFCYWHNPSVPEDEKMRNRSLGGRSSRKIELWQVPEDISQIETLLDVKRAYNSLLSWLLQGFITPSQAIAAKSLVSGLREAIIDEQTLEILGYRQKLKAVLGNRGNHELPESVEQEDYVINS